MAVPWARFLAALQECKEVEIHPRGNNFHLRYKGHRADLRRLTAVNDEYKIKEIRHVVAQLKLDKDVVRKHIQDL